MTENERWGVAPSIAFGLGTPTRLALSYFHLQQDNLDTAIQRLGVDAPDHASVVQLTSVYHNLLRRWADV
ncbi:MAG: hypothetical protein H7Z38_03230 [Rubrivivax sp.]|nr:hypothetical protein [Pyrinomonadaceae bacterium]